MSSNRLQQQDTLHFPSPQGFEFFEVLVTGSVALATAGTAIARDDHEHHVRLSQSAVKVRWPGRGVDVAPRCAKEFLLLVWTDYLVEEQTTEK